MAAFDQREQNRVMVSFLNYQEVLPPAPLAVQFWLRPPTGKRFRRLVLAPDNHAISFTAAHEGVVRANLDAVELLSIVIAHYD